MSRIGKKPIAVPGNVKLAVDGASVNIEGPKGKLFFRMSPRIKANLKDNLLTLSRLSDQKTDKALHGTARSIIWNMIKGVTDGFMKELTIEGVGFKAQVQGKTLLMSLGFTHPVNFEIPEGLTVEAPKPTQVLVKGVDKVKVGHFAAKIREAFPAEPYKGKGIRYIDEVVRRKAGKTVAK